LLLCSEVDSAAIVRPIIPFAAPRALYWDDTSRT
jgi:hypothetical protein